MEKQKNSKKWLWTGLLIAFLNPIFAGFILGLLFSSDQRLKREGRTILVFSVIWGALSIVIIGNLQTKGVLPQF